MDKLYLITLFFFLPSTFCISQTVKRVELRNTEQFIIESELEKGETFAVQVCLPKNYDKNKTYPIILVLDADILIGMTKDIADILMFRNEINNVIMVGLSYDENNNVWWSKRARDFSPTKDSVTAFGKYWPQAGGAKNFLRFLKNKLLPELQYRYSIEKNYSGIIGFSFGGLFATYVLFTDPDLIDNYIILAPASGWDRYVIGKIEEKFSLSHKDLDKNVYIALASQDDKGIVNDPSMKLIDSLKSRNYPNLKLRYDYFEDDTHFSLCPKAFTEGLRYCYIKSKDKNL